MQKRYDQIFQNQTRKWEKHNTISSGGKAFMNNQAVAVSNLFKGRTRFDDSPAAYGAGCQS
jgi:hypothetical protein